jgi:ElaB/YqjD/DUF883 family membrane-anchored ribosome-binding protein
MNRGYEGNGNGSRHPDEIMAEIERTRREMDSTLGAIEERLTPGQLLDQGMDYLKSSGAGDYVRNLRGSVTSNPLPIALVGIGLAWLAAAERMDRSRHGAGGTSAVGPWDATGGGTSDWKGKASHLKDEASGMLQRAKEGAHATTSSMHERASGTVDSMKERASGAMSSMQERAAGAMSAGRQTLDETSRMARERMEQMRGGYRRIVDEQPLALGAIGLAIGAVLAAVLPRTRKEDELLAGTREMVADKASELAKQATDKGREVMEKGKEQLDKAKSSVQQQGQPQRPQQQAQTKSDAQQKQTPATGQQLGASRPPTTR